MRSEPAGLAEQYERLRAYVLARDARSASRLGEGVVTARGMAAWMDVASELVPSSLAPPPSPRPDDAWSLLPSMRRDLIELLGGAVLTLVERGAL